MGGKITWIDIGRSRAVEPSLLSGSAGVKALDHHGVSSTHLPQFSSIPHIFLLCGLKLRLLQTRPCDPISSGGPIKVHYSRSLHRRHGHQLVRRTLTQLGARPRSRPERSICKWNAPTRLPSQQPLASRIDLFVAQGRFTAIMGEYLTRAAESAASTLASQGSQLCRGRGPSADASTISSQEEGSGTEDVAWRLPVRPESVRIQQIVHGVVGAENNLQCRRIVANYH